MRCAANENGYNTTVACTDLRAQMTTSPRRQMLENFVAQHPNDAFGRYGLAMECVTAGELPQAEEHFAKLVAANPNYVPAYYHYGQLLARLDG